MPWLNQPPLVQRLVELVDVFPTLADLANLTLPAGDPVPLDGKSLVPLLEAQAVAKGQDPPGQDLTGWPTEQALTQFPRCANGENFAELPLSDEDAEVWADYGMGQDPRVSTNITLPLWDLNDCDGVNRNDFSHMGLSLRTPAWRLTIWYAWDGGTLQPVWESNGKFGVELYDHASEGEPMSFDSSAEAINLADEPALADTKARLTTQLETAFGRYNV